MSVLYEAEARRCLREAETVLSRAKGATLSQATISAMIRDLRDLAQDVDDGAFSMDDAVDLLRTAADELDRLSARVSELASNETRAALAAEAAVWVSMAEVCALLATGERR